MGKVNDLIADGKKEAAAAIVYDALLGIINAGSPQMSLSRKEWDIVAPELVKKMQNPSAGGSSEPTPEPGDDIEIKDETAVLTIKLVGPEGFKAKDMTKNILVGVAYKVATPEFEGYTADKEFVEGTMTAEATTVTVTYTANVEPEPPVEEKATLTILYEGPVGGDFVAPDPVEQEVVVGASFSVTSPAVEGYTPDKAVVEGTMVKDGVEEVVTYTKNVVDPEE